MTTARRYTSRDLELLPDPMDGTRYEIIDGEFYVSRQPHLHHQYVCTTLMHAFHEWNKRSGDGMVLGAPGVIFSPENDIAPDLIWISNARIAQGEDEAGHFRIAPELVVEVLSDGSANERRDREIKLSLYSRQGVREYWIADWRRRSVQVYCRQNEALQLALTLDGDDVLTTPLLPGFACPLSELWVPSLKPERDASADAGG